MVKTSVKHKGSTISVTTYSLHTLFCPITSTCELALALAAIRHRPNFSVHGGLLVKPSTLLVLLSDLLNHSRDIRQRRSAVLQAANLYKLPRQMPPAQEARQRAAGKKGRKARDNGGTAEEASDAEQRQQPVDSQNTTHAEQAGGLSDSPESLDNKEHKQQQQEEGGKEKGKKEEKEGGSDNQNKQQQPQNGDVPHAAPSHRPPSMGLVLAFTCLILLVVSICFLWVHHVRDNVVLGDTERMMLERQWQQEQELEKELLREQLARQEELLD